MLPEGRVYPPPPLIVIASRAVAHARQEIPNTWNRLLDFDRMVNDVKAISIKDAKQKLKAESIERRKQTQPFVDQKCRPSKKPWSIGGFKIYEKVELPELLDRDEVVIYDGELAKEHNVGNCGEMAAVAYGYLREQGVTGLHYVNMVHNTVAVHTFVVIGANSITQEKQSIEHTDDAVRAFGNDAIICDPWLGDGGEVFVVKNSWKEAVDQMIYECALPSWAKVTFYVWARSNALTRKQKEEKWWADFESRKK